MAFRLRHEDDVYLNVVIDRTGRVISATLVRSSGSGALDREALSMVHRASPLPPLPPEIKGATISIELPVQFFLQS